MNRTATIWTITSATLVTGLVAYAVYFDYKRRNDTEFRKKLRKEKKRVDKSIALQESAVSSNEVTPAQLRAALEQARNEPPPQNPQDKETYFMTQVAIGERFAVQGPEFYLQSALAFYMALRVYPSPVELITIYQKTMPEAVFGLVMALTNLDVKDRIEGYYSVYPPRNMNVTVETQETVDPDGNTIRKKILVLAKDIAEGEVIYKEMPVVAALDFDLEGKGTHCTYCLRQIETGTAIRPDSDRLNSAYCSKDCQARSKAQSQNLLFGLEPVVPGEMLPTPISPADTAARDKAQAAFVEYIKRSAKAAPLLVARFIARQVANETAKMNVDGTLSNNLVGSDLIETEGGEYSLNDHIERLRYLEVQTSEQEMNLLRAVLQTALAGLEQFVTDERHATLLGKMSYNSYGVCFDGGRDDKPSSTERPEDMEKSRTPHGTSRQIGSGFYAVSAYISHSCAPTASPSFDAGTSELHLIANKSLKKGDEVTVAYVDVERHPGESPADARKRRRMELARGWRFACSCTRCLLDSEGKVVGEDEVALSQTDESKVEGYVDRVEQGKGPGDP